MIRMKYQVLFGFLKQGQILERSYAANTLFYWVSKLENVVCYKFLMLLQGLKLLPILTLCMLGNFSSFCLLSADIFQNYFFSKKKFRYTTRVSNCLDPDKD